MAWLVQRGYEEMHQEPGAYNVGAPLPESPFPDWLQAIAGHVYYLKTQDQPREPYLVAEQYAGSPLYEAAMATAGPMMEARLTDWRQTVATPTDEPLWAPSETVPFISRTTGVPLSYSAGGGGAQAQPYQPAGRKWLIIAALAAWYFFG